MAESFFEFREKLTRRPEPPPSPASKTPLSVSELTRQIDKALRQHLPATVLVKGEVSNFNAHAGSGHLYFTLKDPDACLDCVMFRSDAARVKFTPNDGMELLASGSIKLYPQRGRYQLYVSRLEPLGQGALELAFQQLRKKLEKEGLFAAGRKKPLPAYPARIVLVTASQAAALHDMLKVLRRFPWLVVSVYAVPVQGEGAANKIAAALAALHKWKAADVILLARGGGSLEDLWAFNEEVVARAIAACVIPVITGIGHEVDVSIADLVADYHAHTPTEAAQVVTAHWRSASDLLAQTQFRLGRALREQLGSARQRLDAARRHEFFRRPLDLVNALRQRLDDRQQTMRIAIRDRLWKIAAQAPRIGEFAACPPPAACGDAGAPADPRPVPAPQRVHADRPPAPPVQLDALERTLRAVGPESVLRRGFSMTTLKKDGAIVRSATQIKGGEKLVTRLADGSVESTADDPRQPRLFE